MASLPGMGAFDAALLRYFNQPGLPWLDLLMLGLSNVLLLLALLAAAAGWMKGQKARGLEGIAALFIATGFALGLSAAVARQHEARGRPCAQPGLVATVAECPPGGSLPS